MKRVPPAKWTEEEHRMLLEGHAQFGPKPEKILHAYPSLQRSALAVKNKFKSIGKLVPVKHLEQFKDEIKKHLSRQPTGHSEGDVPQSSIAETKETETSSAKDVLTKCQELPIEVEKSGANLWSAPASRFLFVGKNESCGEN